MTDPDTPRRAGYHSGAGLYFDDDGAPVEVSMPADGDAVEPDDSGRADARRLRLEGFRLGLDFIAGGARDADAVGRRVVAWQYLLRTERGPRTQRELAARLGLSLGTVNALCGSGDAELVGLRGVLNEHGAQG